MNTPQHKNDRDTTATTERHPFLSYGNGMWVYSCPLTPFTACSMQPDSRLLLFLLMLLYYLVAAKPDVRQVQLQRCLLQLIVRMS